MRYNDTYKDKERIKIKDFKKFSIVHQHQHSIFNFSLLSLSVLQLKKSHVLKHMEISLFCFFLQVLP